MLTDFTEKGLILRVRLTPNAVTIGVKGLFKSADETEYLKINVRAVPEKNKANIELIKFLSKEIGVAKSDVEIIGGATDRCKKVLFHGEENVISPLVENWLKRVLADASNTDFRR